MKPYRLLINSKDKAPRVIGKYKTRGAAEEALKHFIKRHMESLAAQKKYPGQGVEELYRDLKIVGPDEN